MSRRLDDHWCLRRRELSIVVGRLGSSTLPCGGFLCCPVGLTLILPKEEPSLLAEASPCLPCIFEKLGSLILLGTLNENFVVSKCTQSPQWQGGVHCELWYQKCFPHIIKTSFNKIYSLCILLLFWNQNKIFTQVMGVHHTKKWKQNVKQYLFEKCVDWTWQQTLVNNLR